MKHNLFTFYFLSVVILLAGCSSDKKPESKDTLKKQDTVKQAIQQQPLQNEDVADLTKLTRNLYKWVETKKPKRDGFKPVKADPTDTLYTGIDLAETDQAVKELKATGFFTDEFLDQYRKVAERMDKELRNGTSIWGEGDMPSFGPDANEWCNCQDYPDNYWDKLTLTHIKIDQANASFDWTWGDNFYYKTKAKKENGSWKITYLQGFDMKNYDWEWVLRHKK